MHPLLPLGGLILFAWLTRKAEPGGLGAYMRDLPEMPRLPVSREDQNVLAAKAQAGDEGAWQMLIQANWPLLAKYTNTFAKSYRRPASDFLVDVLAAYKRAVLLHDPTKGALTTLIPGAVRSGVRQVNANTTAAKRRGEVVSLTKDDRSDWTITAPELEDSQEVEIHKVMALVKAKARFTLRQREILRMHLEGREQHEIAEDLGVSRQAIGQTLQRLRRWLAQHSNRSVAAKAREARGNSAWRSRDPEAEAKQDMVVRLLQAGKTLTEVQQATRSAFKTGRTFESIQATAKRLGLHQGRSAQRLWLKSDEEKMLQMSAAGASAPEIARATGWYTTKILQELRRAGVQSRRRVPYTKEELDRLYRLLGEGKSTREIAVELDKTKDSIDTMLYRRRRAQKGKG